MRLNKLALALSLACSALPISALAQDAGATANPAQQTEQAASSPASEEDAESNFSWNLAVTSDYVFRGITQTDFAPALQGGVDYAFGDSGFYIGAWASNVDFADSDGPDLELDTFIGYSVDASEMVNLDFSIVRYSYFGEREVYGSLDYNEFFAKATFNEMITLTAAYAPDYANLDFSSTYFNIAGSWEVGNEFSLNAAIGRSNFSDDVGSYTDWTIGVSRQFGPVNVALGYFDTDGDYVDALYGDHKASDSVVLTLAFGG